MQLQGTPDRLKIYFFVIIRHTVMEPPLLSGHYQPIIRLKRTVLPAAIQFLDVHIQWLLCLTSNDNFKKFSTNFKVSFIFFHSYYTLTFTFLR